MSEEKKVAPASEAKPEKKQKKAKRPGGNRIAKWFRELRSELKKVSWPSRKQVLNNTWVVLVVTAVCAVAIWGFDYVAGLIVRTLIDFSDVLLPEPEAAEEVARVLADFIG